MRRDTAISAILSDRMMLAHIEIVKNDTWVRFSKTQTRTLLGVSKSFNLRFSCSMHLVITLAVCDITSPASNTTLSFICMTLSNHPFYG